jgi:hypothetical protein
MLNPNIDYNLVSYDYASLKADFLARIQASSEWADISVDDSVLDLFLYILSYGMSYKLGTINKTFEDFLPHSSSSEVALYRFANFIGLDINGALSATGTVTFSLPTVNNGVSVVIPINTKISTSDGSIIFSTIETKTIANGQTSVNISVIQGELKSKTFTSDGSNNQKYSIYSIIDDLNLVVKVNGTAWSPVDNFFNSTNIDNHYVRKYIKDGFYILFNDGVYGKKPELNDEIIIQYYESKGLSGNVYQSSLLNTIIDTIYNSNNVVITDITVSNSSAIANGSDQDSINSIKSKISSFFPTNPYITRKQDYIEYLKLYISLVADANAYAGWEIYPNDTTKWTTLYLQVVPPNGDNLSTNDKMLLYDYLKLKDTFFTQIFFNDITYIPIQNNITLKFKTSLSQAAITNIQNNITTAVQNFYDIPTVVSNGETVFRNIYHYELAKVIGEVSSDIKKINLNLQTVESIETVLNNQTSFSKDLNFKDLLAEETYLYVNDELIGTYDNSFVLTDLQDNTSLGSIDWDGKISSSIDPTLKILSISILDPDVTDNTKSKNIVGKILKLRSNPTNKEDINASNSDMVFIYNNISFTFES